MKKSTKKVPFQHKGVAKLFDGYPKNIQQRLLSLRHLIFEIAATTKGVGKIEETLKWDSPSYLTTDSGSGTTIRIDQLRLSKDKYGIFVHCQTNLVGPFKKIYGDQFVYDANRGLILDVNDEIPVKELTHFINLALTYHLRKKPVKLKDIR
jgi:hypothetical protein